jgi:hypothetical protein
MAGKLSRQRLLVPALLCGVLGAVSRLPAQNENADVPPGIAFDPPRSCRIREASGNLTQADLLHVSSEMVRLRARNGKEFERPLRRVTSIRTIDGEFSYSPEREQFDDALRLARKLTGVTIISSTGSMLARWDVLPFVPLPRPPSPPVATMVDPPPAKDVASDGGSPAVAAPSPAPPPPPARPPAGDFVRSSLLTWAMLIVIFAAVAYLAVSKR